MDDVTVEREIVWTLYRNGEPVRNADGQIATFETEMEARKAAGEPEGHGVPFQSLTERADGRAQAQRRVVAERHARSNTATQSRAAHDDKDDVIHLDR